MLIAGKYTVYLSKVACLREDIDIENGIEYGDELYAMQIDRKTGVHSYCVLRQNAEREVVRDFTFEEFQKASTVAGTRILIHQFFIENLLKKDPSIKGQESNIQYG